MRTAHHMQGMTEDLSRFYVASITLALEYLVRSCSLAASGISFKALGVHNLSLCSWPALPSVLAPALHGCIRVSVVKHGLGGRYEMTQEHRARWPHIPGVIPLRSLTQGFWV